MKKTTRAYDTRLYDLIPHIEPCKKTKRTARRELKRLHKNPTTVIEQLDLLLSKEQDTEIRQSQILGVEQEITNFWKKQEPEEHEKLLARMKLEILHIFETTCGIERVRKAQNSNPRLQNWENTLNLLRRTYNLHSLYARLKTLETKQILLKNLYIGTKKLCKQHMQKPDCRSMYTALEGKQKATNLHSGGSILVAWKEHDFETNTYADYIDLRIASIAQKENAYLALLPYSKELWDRENKLERVSFKILEKTNQDPTHLKTILTLYVENTFNFTQSAKLANLL